MASIYGSQDKALQEIRVDIGKGSSLFFFVAIRLCAKDERSETRARVVRSQQFEGHHPDPFQALSRLSVCYPSGNIVPSIATLTPMWSGGSTGQRRGLFRSKVSVSSSFIQRP